LNTNNCTHITKNYNMQLAYFQVRIQLYVVRKGSSTVLFSLFTMKKITGLDYGELKWKDVALDE